MHVKQRSSLYTNISGSVTPAVAGALVVGVAFTAEILWLVNIRSSTLASRRTSHDSSLLLVNNLPAPSRVIAAFNVFTTAVELSATQIPVRAYLVFVYTPPSSPEALAWAASDIQKPGKHSAQRYWGGVEEEVSLERSSEFQRVSWRDTGYNILYSCVFHTLPRCTARCT